MTKTPRKTLKPSDGLGNLNYRQDLKMESKRGLSDNYLGNVRKNLSQSRHLIKLKKVKTKAMTLSLSSNQNMSQNDIWYK